MNRNEIYDEINGILNKMLEHEEEYRFEGSICLAGKGAILDSLHAVELLTWCEEHYGIDIILSDLSMKYLDSLDCLIDEISASMKGR